MVVFGTGAVGFAAIMAAKIAGCYPIIAVDINEKRLQTAKEIGASHIINSKDTNADAMILQLTKGTGVDYALDTTGVGSVMTQALKSLTSSGTFAPLAVTKEDFKLNTFFDLVFGNKKIIGVLIGDTIPKYHLPKLIEFYKQGKFPFDQFIQLYDFADINQAEEASVRGEVIKPVVVMDKSYQPPS